MKPVSHFRAALGLTLSLALAGIFSQHAWALIDYSDGQRSTMVELIEQLEERHYAKLQYDDDFSSHLTDDFEKARAGAVDADIPDRHFEGVF